MLILSCRARIAVEFDFPHFGSSGKPLVKLTDFGASRNDAGAIQNGQHNRWFAADTCGESAAVVLGEVHEYPTPRSPTNPDTAIEQT